MKKNAYFGYNPDKIQSKIDCEVLSMTISRTYPKTEHQFNLLAAKPSKKSPTAAIT